MGTVKASNLEQAKQLLQSGDAIKLELDFELDSDEFFNFAIEYYKWNEAHASRRSLPDFT